MKKLISLVLIMASCICAFTSCRDAAKKISDHAFSNYDLSTDFFTALADENCSGDSLNVTVCEKYRDKIGKKVTVNMSGLADLGIKKGDEIRVYVDSFTKKFRLIANASSVQILSFNIPTDSNYVTLSAEEIGITSFTCTANGAPINGTVSVRVDEEFRDKLNTIANVSMTDPSYARIRQGDRLRVTIEWVKDTLPCTVYAGSFEVLERVGNSSDYGFGPFYIPRLSEIAMPVDFPELTADTQLSAQIHNYDWYSNELRVFDIRDDVIYLADINGKTVTHAIIGIPDCSFAINDHVRISVEKYYCEYGSRYNVAYADDINGFEVLRGSDIPQAYISYSAVDKPVIYLYPKDTEVLCSVKVELDGILTCTYPDHANDGWQNFIARPDGTLIFPDAKEYYCLYWEGQAQISPDFSKGFCVKGEDTASFLGSILEKIGLTPREANEFIIYWLPLLQKNEYNLISFQSEAYTDIAKLIIDPAPDSMLRVYMAARPLEAPIDIEPQSFDGFIREGFTVVEWGGSILD